MDLNEVLDLLYWEYNIEPSYISAIFLPTHLFYPNDYGESFADVPIFSEQRTNIRVSAVKGNSVVSVYILDNGYNWIEFIREV